ncbi:MAG: HlyD family efflux transporter periplasmic adaptor subunit, partial [Bacteroidetes bacterium]|nr:HlyD family efflux transporter periplasmic adaptor subunit [Bacteroidota bacterium]
METEIQLKNRDSKPGDSIELRSEEIQDILTRPPHSLIRHGITVVCAVVMVIVLGSFFFKYPDIVSGEMVLTTENPPAWIASKVTGRIKELYCHDQQPVAEGQLLAVIDNAANTQDVQLLDKLLGQVVVSDSVVSIPSSLLEHIFQLGDLQSSYSSFVKAAVDYRNFQSMNVNMREKVSIERQMAGKKISMAYFQQQLRLKERELGLAKEEFQREKMLYGRGIISKSDLETAEQTYLSAQQAYSQLQSSTMSSRIESDQLGESVKKLDLQHRQDRNLNFSALNSSYRELIASVQSWKKNYMLVAPTAGRVSFIKFWQTNQLVEANGKVFSVVPDRSGELLGKAELLSASSGKIKAGQRVNIKLDNYPYLEYGVVVGRVEAISLLPDEDGKYTVS